MEAQSESKQTQHHEYVNYLDSEVDSLQVWDAEDQAIALDGW
jgi:hypothetical protein